MSRLYSLVLIAVFSFPAFSQTTRLVHVFSGGNGTGGDSVTLDQSGKVFGVATSTRGSGVFFQLTPPVSGTTWTAVAPGFSSNVGLCPCSELIQDANGNFYGTAQGGGTLGLGTVFELTPGGVPMARTLHSFNGQDGSRPAGRLAFDAKGNLFGTTSWGGDNNYGVVFELSPGKPWTEKILHSFNLNGVDGTNPAGAVIFDQAGNMYGSTSEGGPVTQCGEFLCSYGTVFKINAQGQESVLYAFTTNTNGMQDAQYPQGDLAMDAQGNLYGTSESGGTILCDMGANTFGGCGTVFEIVLIGGGAIERVIHEFNGTKGAFPFSNVVFDAQGNLYGTTYEGGTSYGKVWPSYGIAYKLFPTLNGGWAEKILHNFTLNGHDGNYPFGNVALDGAGHLYGSTAGGGSSTQCGSSNGIPLGCGTVFQVTLP